MNQKNKIPIVEGLFKWPSNVPRLIASRCKRCGVISFPRAPFCNNPDCEKVRENVEEILLSNRGKLFTYTIQRYMPPEPFRYEPDNPYGVGMVDLPEGVRVLGMLSTIENLRIGMEVEMTVDRLYEDEEKEYITYVWEPMKSGG